MNDMATAMPDPLLFTESAANKVKSLIEEEGNNELKLRVFVTGGSFSLRRGARQAVKLDPQPQVVVAFGFLITNCAPSSPSV